MKYIITNAMEEYGDFKESQIKEFLKIFADFKLSVSEKIIGEYGVFYNLFLEINTLEEFDKFVIASECPVIYNDMVIERNGCEYTSIRIYDDYIE